MKSGSFRGKPSETHIIWMRKAGDAPGKKRFDRAHFEKWAKHCGFDFETETRVDHDRAGEPREQCRCVFSWGQIGDTTIQLGEEEWSMGAQKTPRTFIEIDSEGLARVRGWEFETTVDITTMFHKGPELFIETAAGSQKRLNGRKFLTDPRERQREGTE